MKFPPVTDEELSRTIVLPEREVIYERFRMIADNPAMGRLYERIAVEAGREMTVIGICELFDISVRRLMAQGWQPEGLSYPVLSVNILMYLAVLIEEKNKEVGNLIMRCWGEGHPEIYTTPPSCP